jgi:hypothetical protein
VRGRGHRGSQHANATEFFGCDSQNLPHWMLAATVSVKVALESACIMLLGFRVRLLGLRSAHFHVAGHLHPHLLRTLVIAVRTCCEVSRTEMAQACAKAPSPFPPSPSAPVAQSPARRRRPFGQEFECSGSIGALSARPPILFRRFSPRFGGLRSRLRRGGRGLRRLRACRRLAFCLAMSQNV